MTIAGRLDKVDSQKHSGAGKDRDDTWAWRQIALTYDRLPQSNPADTSNGIIVTDAGSRVDEGWLLSFQS